MVPEQIAWIDLECTEAQVSRYWLHPEQSFNMTANFLAYGAWTKWREPSRFRGLLIYVPLLAATLLCAACGSGEGDEPSRRDSSGPTLGELLRIGDESKGDTVLFGYISELVTVDQSGRIFVGDAQDRKIHAFTADGHLIRTFGQQGRGPGEFERLRSIHAGPGDTLYAIDSRLERLSAYEPANLDLAYDFAVAQDSLGLPYVLVGVVENQGFLITFGWPVTPGDDLEDDRLYMLRVGWAGQVLPPYVHYLPNAEWLVSGEGADRFAVGMPFGRDPVYRLGLRGNIYAGWTEFIDIAVTSLEGAYSESIAYSLDPIPLTRTEIERFVEDSPDWYRTGVLRAELPKTKPAFETFVVDDLARLWIKVWPKSIADTTAQWLIVDSESRLQGQVQLPVKTDLRVIREGKAYAVDQSEQTSLVVYAIRE